MEGKRPLLYRRGLRGGGGAERARSNTPVGRGVAARHKAGEGRGGARRETPPPEPQVQVQGGKRLF
eukprot:scaffold19609_cov19-Tisochrysis_lutea.AAC.1